MTLARHQFAETGDCRFVRQRCVTVANRSLATRSARLSNLSHVTILRGTGPNAVNSLTPQSVFLSGEASFLRVWFRASICETHFKHKRSAAIPILGDVFLVRFSKTVPSTTAVTLCVPQTHLSIIKHKLIQVSRWNHQMSSHAALVRWITGHHMGFP